MHTYKKSPHILTKESCNPHLRSKKYEVIKIPSEYLANAYTPLTQTNLPWKLGHFFIYHPKLPNEVPSGNQNSLVDYPNVVTHLNSIRVSK